MTATRLRARDLHRPARGIRTTRPPADLEALCRAMARRLPSDAAFSHSTAARLMGLPLPRREDRLVPLHVAVPRGRRAVDAEGIIGHQFTLHVDDVTLVDGIRMTSAGRTWCDLASLLTVVELVAVGDALLHSALASAEQLAASAFRHRDRRGRAARARALPLLDGRAESPAETRLRLLLRSAGIGPLLVNEPVFDDRGTFVARPDLRLEHPRVIFEYEGDHHRTDAAQWRRDIERVESLQACGWRVMRVTARDLANPVGFLSRVRRTLVLDARRGGR